VDLTALLSRTLASTGITGARAARDIADLFNGQANRIVALKALGITNEEINGAKAKGELFEYLQGKLNGYKEAVDAASNTTERLEQALANTKSQVAAEATKELTQSYKELLISLNALVKSEGFSEMLKFIAGAAKGAVDAATAISTTSKAAGDALSGGPKSEAGYQAVKDTLSSDQVTGIATALGQLGPLLIAKAGSVLQRALRRRTTIIQAQRRGAKNRRSLMQKSGASIRPSTPETSSRTQRQRQRQSSELPKKRPAHS